MSSAMAPTFWTDANTIQPSSSPSAQPEPRRSAPPIMQQPPGPQTQEEVLWDDSMMDLDDYEHHQPLETQIEPVAAREVDQELQSIETG